MITSAVVAMSKNRVIGKNNQLPWKLPEDLKRFRALTLGHPVVMGRKTFESIGRALPGRINIVISRQPDYRVPGGWVAPNLEEALTLAETQWMARHSDMGSSSTFGISGISAISEIFSPGQIFIIGGAEIYRLALPRLDRLYLTEIHQKIDGDAFFPDFSDQEFKEVHREERSEPFPFSFLEYRRHLSP
jgi:dihydrofolate reductase